MNNVSSSKADFGKSVPLAEVSEIKSLMAALHQEVLSTNEVVNTLIEALSPVSTQEANSDSLPSPLSRKCPLSNELDQRLNDFAGIRCRLKNALNDLCI